MMSQFDTFTAYQIDLPFDSPHTFLLFLASGILQRVQHQVVMNALLTFDFAVRR